LGSSAAALRRLSRKSTPAAIEITTSAITPRTTKSNQRFSQLEAPDGFPADSCSGVAWAVPVAAIAASSWASAVPVAAAASSIGSGPAPLMSASGVGVAVGLGPGVSLGVGVSLPVSVAVTVGVALGGLVFVIVGVLVGGPGVLVMLGVSVRVGVRVIVGVFVIVDVSVTVGVFVMVAVEVLVGVSVGVFVAGGARTVKVPLFTTLEIELASGSEQTTLLKVSGEVPAVAELFTLKVALAIIPFGITPSPP
jgi:hypothetical protein